MLHMPTPMLMQSGGKTYADWAAHAEARGAALGWESNYYRKNWEGPLGIFDPMYDPVQLVQASGHYQGYAIYGSPWGTSARFLSSFSSSASSARHCLPSEAEWVSQMANRGLLLFAGNFQGVATNVSTRLSRNGLLSSAATSTTPNPEETRYYARVHECSYWDFSLGKPMTMNPVAMTGPSEYAHPQWNS